MRLVSRSGIGAVSLYVALAPEFTDGEDARMLFSAARTEASLAPSTAPRNAAATRARALVFHWGDLNKRIRIEGGGI